MKLSYRADIDGLRAIAVLAVIVYHFSPEVLPGGFLGVDVFFVISGYLITSILIRENEQGGISLSAFWSRRIRRLLPAFAVMAIIICAVGYLLMPGQFSLSAANQTIATLFAVNNWYLWKAFSNYWGQSAESAPLLHTWSLSVEEQFYLLFPLLVVFGFKYFGSRRTAFALATCTAVLAFHAFIEGSKEPSKAFYMAPARAWELLAGVLMAFRGNHIPVLLRSEYAKWIGLLLVCLALLLGKGDTFVPMPGALMAVAGACLICCPLDSPSRCPGLLTSRPLVYIGRASYSLYLWHWPPMVIAGALSLAWPQGFFREMALVVGLVMGLISYHLVEPLGRSKNFVKLGAPILLLLTLGLAFGIRYELKTPEMSNPHNVFVRPIEKTTPCVLLIGDSHAAVLYPALKSVLSEDRKNIAASVASGLAIVPGFNSKSFESLKRWKETKIARDSLLELPVSHVVIQCRWDSYASSKDLSEIEKEIDRIRRLLPSAKIVVIGQPPLYNCGVYDAAEWSDWVARVGAPIVGIVNTPSQLEGNSKLRDICERSGIQYIDADGLIKSAISRLDDRRNAHQFYLDGDHLSLKGAQLIAEEVRKKLM